MKINKWTFFFILHLFYALPANAELITHNFNGVIYVDKTTVAEIEDLFKKNHYTRFRALQNYEFPAIFINKLPSDYLQISPQKYRNELFIRMMTPLALKINEELSNERHTLLRLERSYDKNQKLSPEETEKLENLALKYDYFTRAKNPDTRIPNQLKNLKQRIDIIPPSIFVAVAAMETNWGTSRVAIEANSLYKEKVWYTNEGLEPKENKDDGYRFKIFDRLIDSMRSFALTFNSNISYESAWIARENATLRQKKLIGQSIAYSLSHASNLPNYVGILDYTTAFYDFLALDNGNLKRIKE